MSAGWAALWLPPGVQPDEDRMIAVLEDTVSKERRPHIDSIVEQMAGFHPDEPHWYLPLMGVDPRHQRNGLGSALLRHTLERCDREGRLAYLEASNQDNRRLYERHGFEAIGTIHAGDSPTIFPMLRKPQ
jgi:ribosomal protein S18 acetylase RimI-like enzyme